MAGTLSRKKIEGVLGATPLKRYGHFVKAVADRAQVWVLDQGGWAFASDNDSHEYLAVWPSREFAELCSTGAWEKHEPVSIEVHHFLNSVLPDLRRDGFGVAVFITPQSIGFTPSLERVEADIRSELSTVE